MSIRRVRSARVLSFALLGVFAVAATGCQATGMGWIPSKVVPTDKATFGFKFEQLGEPAVSSLSGSYHDPQGMLATGIADVAFKGVGTMRKCAQNDVTCARQFPGAKGLCLEGIVEYESQNPALRGSGHVLLTFCDGTEQDPVTGEAADFMGLTVIDGPYMGYENEGQPHGNITVQG